MNGLYVGISAAIFGGELLIKNHVEKTIPAGETREVPGGRILIRKYHNEGACLDVGSGHREAVTACSVVLTAALGAAFGITLTGKGNGWLKTGLSLLLGGACSNTFDRLRRKYVVDYFSFSVKWPPLRRVVFNLADFCILTGALMVAMAGEGDGSGGTGVPESSGSEPGT